MASKKKNKDQPAQEPVETTPQAEEAESDLRDPAREMLIRCLERVTCDDAGHYVENPAIQFTKDAKNGIFDDMSDDEYNAALHRIERLSMLWNKKPRRTAGEILLSMLERITIPTDKLEAVAWPLMACYDQKDGWLDEHGNPRTPSGGEAAASAAVETAFQPRTPAEIRDMIARRVIGQEDAAKAAAMIVYNQLSGRRTNAVFCGPSGCGKTEIWRFIESAYPKLVKIADASRLSAEGWAGSLHVRNLFQDSDPDSIQRQGLILVLDEADKLVCEKAVGASGTDHNRITQNNLLRMMDGDTIEFGAENGQTALSVPCEKVSVVMLGTFETLLKNKAHDARHIGFGKAPEADPAVHKDITYDDLIDAGMRQEIAGRINRIVALNPLDAGRYKDIIKGPALSDLTESIGRPIIIDAAAMDALSEQAAKSGLGVRWAKSAMRNAVDDAMFGMADAEEFRIGMDGGKLRCRALKHPDMAKWIEEEPALPF